MECDEREERCINYLNSLLEEPILTFNTLLKEPITAEKLKFSRLEGLVEGELYITNIDLFHQVAQALKHKGITFGLAGLSYYVRVPRHASDGGGDLWNVNLAGYQDINLNFLKKYGKYYKLRSKYARFL